MRIKQDHDRAQHLISGLGNIVAGSLDLPLSLNRPLQSAQDSREKPLSSAEAHGTTASTVSGSVTTGKTAVDDIEERQEHPSSDSDNIEHNLDSLQLDDVTVANHSQQAGTSILSSSAVSQSSSDTESSSGRGQKPRSGRRDGDDDESMFAEITRSIFHNTDVDGVLILDAQVASSFAESLYSHNPSRRHSSARYSSARG